MIIDLHIVTNKHCRLARGAGNGSFDSAVLTRGEIASDTHVGKPADPGRLPDHACAPEKQFCKKHRPYQPDEVG